MNYILNEEELKELQSNLPKIQTLQLFSDLRQKILEQANFTCYHDIPPNIRRQKGVDEGWCDSCPLSFCQNEHKVTAFKMCGHDDSLYSK